MGRRRFIFGLLLCLTNCRNEAVPSYTRLSGAAPRIDGAQSSRATLVVFWATWCVPCREETPSLRRFATSLPDGLQLIVVSEDESIAEVTKFLGGEPPAAWNFRLDSEQRYLKAFRADKLPAAYLLVGGRAVARFGGVQDWTSRGMGTLLDRLVAEPP